MFCGCLVVAGCCVCCNVFCVAFILGGVVVVWVYVGCFVVLGFDDLVITLTLVCLLVLFVWLFWFGCLVVLVWV